MDDFLNSIANQIPLEILYLSLGVVSALIIFLILFILYKLRFAFCPCIFSKNLRVVSRNNSQYNRNGVSNNSSDLRNLISDMDRINNEVWNNQPKTRTVNIPAEHVLGRKPGNSTRLVGPGGGILDLESQNEDSPKARLGSESYTNMKRYDMSVDNNPIVVKSSTNEKLEDIMSELNSDIEDKMSSPKQNFSRPISTVTTSMAYNQSSNQNSNSNNHNANLAKNYLDQSSASIKQGIINYENYQKYNMASTPTVRKQYEINNDQDRDHQQRLNRINPSIRNTNVVASTIQNSRVYQDNIDQLNRVFSTIKKKRELSERQERESIAGKSAALTEDSVFMF